MTLNLGKVFNIFRITIIPITILGGDPGHHGWKTRQWELTFMIPVRKAAELFPVRVGRG